MKIEKLIRKNIQKMQPYSSARDEFKDFKTELIFLDANENPYENGVNRYPDPQQKTVKVALAKLKKVKESQILLGNGSDEVLDLIFRAFCEPKEDNIITLPPTYGMYSVLANLNNIENREVLLTNCFEPNVKNIINIADKNSKILFLCSPNNPTGNSFSQKNVEFLVTTFNGIVVIDEAYIDFSKQESWLTRLEEFSNLIITQTFSKAYGMAGIRLGVCYASEEIIAVLNKIKPPYNINNLTQKYALKKISELAYFKRDVKNILVERDSLIKGLKEIKFIKHIYPSDANFVLVEVDDAIKRYNELIAKGIVIRNRTTQPLCKNTLRLTVGTKKETQLLLKALNKLQYE